MREFAPKLPLRRPKPLDLNDDLVRTLDLLGYCETYIRLVLVSLKHGLNTFSFQHYEADVVVRSLHHSRIYTAKDVGGADPGATGRKVLITKAQ